MKSYIKVQTQLKNIKQISEKFTVATCSISEKSKDGEWTNIYLSMNFYNIGMQLDEETIYNIVGRLGIKPKYNNQPAQVMVHVSEVKVFTPEVTA